MTQPGNLFPSGPFVRWLKYIQLSERQRKNIFFCHEKGARFIFYAKCIEWLSRLILELGQALFMSVDVLTRHKELCMATLVQFTCLMLQWEPGLKANTHDVISCTQPFSNSLIRKFSLWFQNNSTEELYDTNHIVCWPLNNNIIPILTLFAKHNKLNFSIWTILKIFEAYEQFRCFWKGGAYHVPLNRLLFKFSKL